MKKLLLTVIIFSALTGAWGQTAAGKENSTQTLIQYLTPINNNLLKGSIENYYKANDAKLIDSILWIKQQRAQLVLSKVKIVAINNYNNIPLKQIITVKDIEGTNAGEYNFFYFDLSNGKDSENTFIGDEIFIVWTQGVHILSDNTGNMVKFNKNDYAGTKGYDCFINDNLWRVIMLIGHDEKKFKDLNINWY